MSEKPETPVMPDQGKREVIADYREVGASGLKRFSGFIYEEFLRELTGWKGLAVYKEMGDNDATISGILYAIDKLCRRVKWTVQPASDEKGDMEGAEFMESCMNDMDQTWIDTISEVLSFLQYGHSLHEINYKRRNGPDNFDPRHRSKYDDGRIGWRGFPIRAQDTLYRWQFDDHGGIQGVEQLAPPHYYHVTIPVEKFLLFRTTIHKNNPEGRSILRGAYRSWYMKKNIENIEGIGVERDLAGLPMLLVPNELLSVNASQEQKALLSELKNIVTNVRRDEQEGIILPSNVYPDGTTRMYEFKLLTTGGTRQLDTDKIIGRYDQRMAMSCLSDFMLLGQNSTGSFALSADKTKLFSMAIGSFLDIICEIFNRYAVPRLFALNPEIEITDYPKVTHGDVESVDLKELGEYLKNLTLAGCPVFPDEKAEEYCRKVANIPEPLDTARQSKPNVNTNDKRQTKITEIEGEPYQQPSGLNTPNDTTPVNGKPPVSTVTTNASGNTETTSRQPGAQTPEQFTRRW